MAAVILVIYPGLGTGLDGGWGGKIGRAWWEEQWGQFGQCSGCSRSVQHRPSSVMVPSPPPPPASLPPGHGHDPSAGDRSARRAVPASEGLGTSASKSSIRRFVITEKAPTRALSWLKAATTAFTFKTLLRHYANQAPRSLNMKLGLQRNYHKGRAAIRHFANRPGRPL